MGQKFWAMLSYWRRKHRDWINKDRYTDINVMVPAPTRDDPIAGIMVTISTGPKRRVMFRVRDLVAWDELWTLPQDVRQRLTNGLLEAHAQAAGLTEDERISYLRKQGVPLYRGDTGEQISEDNPVYHV